MSKSMFDVQEGDVLGRFSSGKSIKTGNFPNLVSTVERITKNQVIMKTTNRIWKHTHREVGQSHFRWDYLTEEEQRLIKSHDAEKKRLKEQQDREREKRQSVPEYKAALFVMGVLGHRTIEQISQDYKDQIVEVANLLGFKDSRSTRYLEWKFCEEQYFFMGVTFDVDKAKRIIQERPRDVVETDITGVAYYVTRPENELDSSLHKIDWEAVDSDKVDLEFPLIAVMTDHGPWIIDGWHRVAKAIDQGITKLPVAALTYEESRQVCPLLGKKG